MARSVQNETEVAQPASFFAGYGSARGKGEILLGDLISDKQTATPRQTTKNIEMDKNNYMTNRQKLLFMVQELHKRGFGKLQIIPSVAPSGLYWRCSFINEARTKDFIASNWIYNNEKDNSSEEIQLTIQELADLFLKENFEFIEHCKGENKEYTKWYSEMLRQLNKEELPYAFADWEIEKGFWETSENNKIKTLPNN